MTSERLNWRPFFLSRTHSTASHPHTRRQSHAHSTATRPHTRCNRTHPSAALGGRHLGVLRRLVQDRVVHRVDVARRLVAPYPTSVPESPSARIGH
eukprot:1319137-Rhodomonas_salina.2